MSFSKHLLSAVLLGGTVFAVATLPLAMLGPKPLAIQVEGKPIFTGHFQDLSAPYIGLVLAMSIGTGATHLAMMRWQQVARKLDRTETQMNTLKHKLHEQETLIEKLSFAPARLQASGLEPFLRNESKFPQEERSPSKREQPKRKKSTSKRSTPSRPDVATRNSHAQVVLKSRNGTVES